MIRKVDVCLPKKKKKVDVGNFLTLIDMQRNISPLLVPLVRFYG